MINFKEWLHLKQESFYNYFGPVYGTGVNDDLFSAVGVRSKYIGPSSSFKLIRRKSPDCLFLKKNCYKKGDWYEKQDYKKIY